MLGYNDRRSGDDYRTWNYYWAGYYYHQARNKQAACSSMSLTRSLTTDKTPVDKIASAERALHCK